MKKLLSEKLETRNVKPHKLCGNIQFEEGVNMVDRVPFVPAIDLNLLLEHGLTRTIKIKTKQTLFGANLSVLTQHC